MEGLFNLPDGARALHIPYEPGFSYDGPGPDHHLEEFPVRSGFCSAITDEWDLDLEKRPSWQVASFLQSWLFFGLLSEFLDYYLEPGQIVDFSNVPHIKFDAIHEVIARLDLKLKRETSNHRHEWIEKAQKSLRFVALVIEGFERYPRRDASSSVGIIALSVRLLVAFIRRCVDKITNPSSTKWFNNDVRRATFKASIDGKQRVGPIPMSADEAYFRQSTSALMDSFERNHWCRSQASHICMLYEYPVANYLACIYRSYPKNINHSNCQLRAKCKANNVSLGSNYKTRHAEDCSEDCGQFSSVDTAELERIIVSGGVPLISLSYGSTKLKVSRAQPWKNYIAMSHVWSGGLGNGKHNALPICQIKKLGEYLHFQTREELTAFSRLKRLLQADFAALLPNPNTYFWMDTLCIPVYGVLELAPSATLNNQPSSDTSNHVPPSPQGTAQNDTTLTERERRAAEVKKKAEIERRAEIKKKAIRHMALIYAGASQVLVLDAELQTLTCEVTKGKRLDGDYLAARVLCSAWMDRAWTLQEGALARKCHFRFRDGSQPFTFQSLVDHYQRNINDVPNTTKLLARESRKRLRGLQASLDTDLRRIIQRVWSAYHVTGALQCERQYLVEVFSGSERDRLTDEWRIPQFVRAWNSLIVRETTKKDDLYEIFANLLDFNTYMLHPPGDGPIPDKERNLPNLIRSCNEFPLALLYNKGPRMRCVECPQNGWIPIETAKFGIYGDWLTESAALRRTKDGLILDASQASRSSLYIFVTSELAARDSEFYVKDLETGELFAVRVQESMDPNDEYVETTERDSFEERAKDLYEGGIGTCIILDKSTGSRSQNGVTATGARFSVTAIRDHVAHIRYDKPLVANIVTTGQVTDLNGGLYELENCLDTHRFILDLGKLPNMYL